MKKVFKILSVIIICLIILCLCVYFVATSSFFIKNAFLPLAGSIIDVKIKVEKIVVSPFSGDFEIKNMEIKSQDGYSLKIGDYNTSINLFSLFKGVIKINYLNLKDTDVHIIQEESFEKVDMHQESEEEIYNKEPDKNKSNFFILDINNIKIKNLNIIYTLKRSTKEKSSVSELLNLNVIIPCLRTGADGSIDYKGIFKFGSETGKDKLTGGLTGKIYTKEPLAKCNGLTS
jgi:hypothetical protein